MKINKKVLGLICIIALVALALTIGIVMGLKDDSKKIEEEKYAKCIKLSNNSLTGAVFTMEFSDVKAVIGRRLSVGDLNSSSGGWQLIHSDSDMKEYGIISTLGIWHINILLTSNNEVLGVVCRTIGLDNNKPNNSELDSFAGVFAEITGYTQESIKSNLVDLSKSNKVYHYQNGIQVAYIINNGFCEFSIMAMTKEYLDGNYVRNSNDDETEKIEISKDNENKSDTVVQEIETSKNDENETNIVTQEEIITKKPDTTEEDNSIEEQTTSKIELPEETTKDESNMAISLSEINDYDNLIKDGSVSEYKVKFGNEEFDMRISNWTTSTSEWFNSSMWHEDNIVITKDFAADANNWYTITIYAFDDFYLDDKVMNAGAHNVQIELKCISNVTYKYDVENTKELYNFVMAIANKLLVKYPIDKGIGIGEFNDYSNVIKVGSDKEYRVRFASEVFKMHIINSESSISMPINDEHVIWYDKNVVVEYPKYGDSVTIYKFPNNYEPGAAAQEGSCQWILILFTCASNNTYKYDIDNNEEVKAFLINLAKQFLLED